jgi:uncharacterized protein (TIGR00730 family)
MGFFIYIIKFYLMNGISGKGRRQWEAIKGENSWTMFKVMSEFVDGFDTMDKVVPSITIFGSARTKVGEKYYELGRTIARRLVEEGFGIVTGGGPGIMEAANKGAFEKGGSSSGLNITLPFEQEANKYIDSDKLINFKYFFIRKVMFVKYSQAFVVMPGGFGTMDELFETLTLIQTQKISKIPVILVGSEYWGGLKDWIANVMLGAEKYVSPVDLDLIPIIDDPEEVVKYIDEFYSDPKKGKLKPNYKL